MYILLVINLLFLFIFILYYQKNKKKIEKRYIEKRKLCLENEIENAISAKVQYRNELDTMISERSQAAQLIESQIEQAKKQKAELTEQLAVYEKEQKAYIDNYLQVIKEIKTKEVFGEIERQSEKAKEELEENYLKMTENFECDKKEKQKQIDALQAQIESFQARQEAINQEILRRRELEEKTDFFRVCLSDEAIMDITELQMVRQKLKKPEIIDKIIYDNYVAKPVLEMIKRVLQNSTCSGIYKITCQETKEIYIGKSTDIKNRWQQHCKTAFNCGTIASSLLHRKMQQYGIENFTFELLEAVPKDKLSEREKFYIDFYKTKETGLNERSG